MASSRWRLVGLTFHGLGRGLGVVMNGPPLGEPTAARLGNRGASRGQGLRGVKPCFRFLVSQRVGDKPCSGFCQSSAGKRES